MSLTKNSLVFEVDDKYCEYSDEEDELLKFDRRKKREKKKGEENIAPNSLIFLDSPAVSFSSKAPPFSCESGEADGEDEGKEEKIDFEDGVDSFTDDSKKDCEVEKEMKDKVSDKKREEKKEKEKGKKVKKKKERKVKEDKNDDFVMRIKEDGEEIDEHTNFSFQPSQNPVQEQRLSQKESVQQNILLLDEKTSKYQDQDKDLKKQKCENTKIQIQTKERKQKQEGEERSEGREREKEDKPTEKHKQSHSHYHSHTHTHKQKKEHDDVSTAWQQQQQQKEELALLWQAIGHNRDEMASLRSEMAERLIELEELKAAGAEEAERRELVVAEAQRMAAQLREENAELVGQNTKMEAVMSKMRIRLFWVTSALGATPNMPAVIPTMLDKMKGLYNILSSSGAIPVSPVPETYEVHNGAAGLNRDIIIKLIDVIGDTRKTRLLMGMCEQHFVWRRTELFVWARSKRNMHVDLVPHPDCKRDFVIEDKVIKVIKTSLDCARMFIRKEIKTGIYHFTCKALVLHQCASLGIYTYSLERPYLVKRASDWAYYVNGGNVFQNGIMMGNNPFLPGEVIEAEVNMDARTLHFFVQGRLQPVSFKQIPSPVRFFVQFRSVGDEMEYISLHRLPRPSFTASTTVDNVWDPRRLHLAGRVVDWNWHELRNR